MDNTLASLDWSLVQAFLAVAETGSLSGAARALGSSQPTLGRKVREIEAAMGAELFRRHAKGLALTDAGQAMLAPAQAMRAAAGQMALIAAGEDRALAGTVRITASVVVSHFVLPPVLVDLRRAYPGIEIDLVASDSSENLLFREADIAVRMYRPGQLDVVTRHVADLPTGAYAAAGYLDRAGRPKTVDDLLALDWVGFDRNEMIIRGMAEAGWNVDRNFFRLRTDDQAAYWQLVRAGGGVGIMQQAIGEREPQVERLLPDMPLPVLPVWLTAHEAVRRVPRVARVWDALSEALAALS
ncbi:LysR family transcriptional regulator [Sinisalibacter aestuarii]|uniref:LysR family transcriptional regulator n=1 Tax=Sinisalibacter aestuarii TaxID=2949426 RepID=A0ABQ5LN18_9RHOB|nr:LysR family transcriptional regulator [Sinisalibacter aestuarii]GKY86348.1 LysR family transcriptional regulator [Sinisalibacter aestuarii]